MYRIFAHVKRRFGCTRTNYTAPIGALAFFGLLGAASASPMGNLAVAGCAGGGVNVNATSITWLGTPGGLAQTGYGCIATTNGGLGTNVTYAGGGPLIAGVTGEIKDLSLSSTSGTDFMDFTGNPNLIFDLGGFFPGPSNTNCSTLTALFQTCAVVAGSFFVLELDPGGTGTCPVGISGTCQTKVGLNVVPSVVRDGTLPNSTWSGSFSTQIPTMSPAQVQSVILGGGTIGSGEAGTFTISVGPTVPEPLTFWMIGLGLIALAIVGRRKVRA